MYVTRVVNCGTDGYFPLLPFEREIFVRVSRVRMVGVSPYIC